MKRREFVTLIGGAGTGAVLTPAVAATPTAAAAAPVPARPTARMVAGCQRSPTNATMLMFFKRHGVDHICGYPADDDVKTGYSADGLQRLRELCDRHGVSLDMIQAPFMSSSSVDRSQRKAIMLAQDPDRQRDIDEVCAIIRNAAAAGIHAMKYNMTLLGVLRTAPTPGRGGSTYSTWKLADAREEPALTRAGTVDADRMWERITYFLERVVPVADEYKVRLACHPHDPGVPARGFRGVVRVLGTVDGMKRFVDIRPSPYHGLNLCLGTTAEMLQDPSREIHDIIRYFGERQKIFNIHFRNIVGKRDDFHEVFPDEGVMAMPQVMRTLREVDYPYMVMPDHMPQHADDPGQHQAFAFGHGYIKALIQAVASEA